MHVHETYRRIWVVKGRILAEWRQAERVMWSAGTRCHGRAGGHFKVGPFLQPKSKTSVLVGSRAKEDLLLLCFLLVILGGSLSVCQLSWGSLLDTHALLSPEPPCRAAMAGGSECWTWGSSVPGIAVPMPFVGLVL